MWGKLYCEKGSRLNAHPTPSTEHHLYKLAGFTSAPQDRQERYGHAIFGNCHIRLKEVQFNGR